MPTDFWSTRHGLLQAVLAAAGATYICCQGRCPLPAGDAQPEERVEHQVSNAAHAGSTQQGGRRRKKPTGVAKRALIPGKRPARRTKRQRAGELNEQRGAAAWSLERALARLALAKLAHCRLGAESPLIEEEWVRYELVGSVQRALPACDIAHLLGTRLRQFAPLLVENGYCSPPALWAAVAKNRKQGWLVEAGMAGAKLRPARQGVIDALVAHRTRYCGDSEREPDRKKRNLLQIMEEPAVAPLEVASAFPDALVLDGLPVPEWEGSTCEETASDSARSSCECPPAVARELGPLQLGSELSEVPAGVVLIVGDTGSGKTALLHHWAAQLLGSGAVDTAGDGGPTGDRAGPARSGSDRVVLCNPIGQTAVQWDPTKAIISQFGDLSTLTHSGKIMPRRHRIVQRCYAL